MIYKISNNQNRGLWYTHRMLANPSNKHYSLTTSLSKIILMCCNNSNRACNHNLNHRYHSNNSSSHSYSKRIRRQVSIPTMLANSSKYKTNKLDSKVVWIPLRYQGLIMTIRYRYVIKEINKIAEF